MIFNTGIPGIGILFLDPICYFQRSFVESYRVTRIHSFIPLRKGTISTSFSRENFTKEFYEEYPIDTGKDFTHDRISLKIPSFEIELLTFVYGIQSRICFSRKTFSKVFANSKRGKNSRKFLYIRGTGDKFAISFLPFTLKPLSPPPPGFAFLSPYKGSLHRRPSKRRRITYVYAHMWKSRVPASR